MQALSPVSLQLIIKEYLESQARFYLYGKKHADEEKEYNKLLAKYTGSSRSYTLAEADQVYNTYLNMLAFGKEADLAKQHFMSMEEKLKEVGQVLFDGSIQTEITYQADTVSTPVTKSITVIFQNDQVRVV